VKNLILDLMFMCSAPVLAASNPDWLAQFGVDPSTV